MAERTTVRPSGWLLPGRTPLAGRVGAAGTWLQAQPCGAWWPRPPACCSSALCLSFLTAFLGRSGRGCP